MRVLSYTPLDLSKLKRPVTQKLTSNKEAEPRVMVDTAKIAENEVLLEEKVESKLEKELPKGVEMVPEVPEVSSKLKQFGVQTTLASNAIFVKNKKIELPLSAEETDNALKKPLDTGIRWMGEIIKYILHKLNYSIKKVRGAFKYVNNEEG